MTDEQSKPEAIVTPKNGGILLGGLLVGALTASLARGSSEPSNVPTTLAPISSGIVHAPVASATPELVGPLTTDLLTEVVQPSEQALASVNLPAGWAPIGDLTLTGDAVGHFKLIAAQLVGTEEKVLVENVGDTPVRFSAVFSYDKAK